MPYTGVASNSLHEAKGQEEIHGLRWRIETSFKAWKSHFRITEVPEGSADPLRSIIYARLIFLTVMVPFCTSGWQAAWQAHQPAPRSLLKVAALMGDFFLLLCLEARAIRDTQALLLQIDYPGRYERRARPNCAETIVNYPDAHAQARDLRVGAGGLQADPKGTRSPA